MFATYSCICWPQWSLWLYWPLHYAQSATHPMSYLPRLYSCYTVALHRCHWSSIWCMYLFLGHKRGEARLPQLTSIVWALFQPCCRLYHLMGSILWNPTPLVHSLCSLPCYLGCPICWLPYAYSYFSLPVLSIAGCPLFLLYIKLPKNKYW